MLTGGVALERQECCHKNTNSCETRFRCPSLAKRETGRGVVISRSVNVLGLQEGHAFKKLISLVHDEKCF